MSAKKILAALGRIKIGASVAVVGAALSHAASAQWTPSAQAPPGTLTHALEAQRHDKFIEIARAGDIDLVFFRHDVHGNVVVERSRPQRVGPRIRHAEGCELRLARLAVQEPAVAYAKR
jgi:hypothetical protein